MSKSLWTHVPNIWAGLGWNLRVSHFPNMFYKRERERGREGAEREREKESFGIKIQEIFSSWKMLNFTSPQKKNTHTRLKAIPTRSNKWLFPVQWCLIPTRTWTSLGLEEFGSPHQSLPVPPRPRWTPWTCEASDCQAVARDFLGRCWGEKNLQLRLEKNSFLWEIQQLFQMMWPLIFILDNGPA